MDKEKSRYYKELYDEQRMKSVKARKEEEENEREERNKEEEEKKKEQRRRVEDIEKDLL